MKQIVIRGLVGLGLGVGFAALQFVLIGAAEKVFHDHTAQPMRSIQLAFGIINAPAEWLTHVWSDALRLPPRGEIAWVVVPTVTVLAQWGFLGLLGGAWWGFRTPPSGATSRIWPVALGGAAAIIACGVLAFILAAVFGHPPQPPTQAHPTPDAAPHEQRYVDEVLEADKAVEANPNDAEAHYHLGMTLASHSRVREAIAHFRKALEIKPDFTEARQHLDKALKSTEKNN